MLATILPVKLAVLPASVKLTVKFGTITLPLKLAVLPLNSKFTVAFDVIKFVLMLALAAVIKALALTLLARTLPAASTLPFVVRFNPDTFALLDIVPLA